MENPITNKTYNKPRDMFDEACLLIFESLEEYGFQFSKSQAKIKMKSKLLAYTISFYSSHYNYIDEDEGHVLMEFDCTISDKGGDIIFHLNQKELRSEIHRFELFDNETKTLDLKQIENTSEFINTHFLPVVFAIQNDVNAFLENMVNQPIARFEDYGFQYDKKIFEIFNRQDLIEKYDKKIEEFNNQRAENDKFRFKKHLLLNFERGKLNELSIDELKSTLQKFHSSANYEAMLKTYFDWHEKLFEKLSKNDILDKTDWLIDYYMFLTSCVDLLEDEEIRNQALEMQGQLMKCFKNNG